MIELAIRGDPGVPAFAGPLDLLLAIVRRNHYPLDRLPLGEITRQFTAYLQPAKEQSLELGSDFFETVSWLVLLKSRALLPEAARSREVPPEEELRRALVAHERVQELGAFLGERLEQAGLGAAVRSEESDAFAAERDPARPSPVPTVHDAVASARRALAAARMHTDAQTAEAGMTIEEALRALAARLATLAPGRACSTEEWLGEGHPAATRSAFLLALLELARLGQLWMFQPAPCAPLWIQRPTDASRDRQTLPEQGSTGVITNAIASEAISIGESHA